MSKGKSEFKFIVNANPNMVNNVIQNYLSINKFNRVQTNDGANYYLFNDPLLVGKRSIEYYINGNEVAIYAYLGDYNNPKPLEGFVGALPKQDFKNNLFTLFNELKKLNNVNVQPQFNNGGNMQMNGGNYSYNTQNGAPMNQNGYNNFGNNMGYNNSYANQMQANNSFEAFEQENNKKRENFTMLGFGISLFGLLISLTGRSFGAIILMAELYLASQGLKTKNRGFAIATFVIAALSMLILVFQIFA